ncbi:uncharacterized protein V1510DRAFT_411776 [Dipodascopsis tothii]|uniref:uncharacterized protein n=1 Tax=Dipodascopsis tothii TaxID=44089 RepID=UPI0034CED48A
MVMQRSKLIFTGVAVATTVLVLALMFSNIESIQRLKISSKTPSKVGADSDDFQLISSYDQGFNDDYDIITNVFATDEQPAMEHDTSENKNKPIYVVNSEQSNNDVLLAYMKTILSIPEKNTGPLSEGAFMHFDIHLFGHKESLEKHGARTLLETFAEAGSNLTFRDMVDLNKQTDEAPGLVLLISCPEDSLAMLSVITSFIDRGSKFLCVVQDASKWDLNESDGSLSPYKSQIEYMKRPLLRGQWQLLTLSPHVTRYAQEHFSHFFQSGTYIDFSLPSVMSTVAPVFKSSEYEIISIDPKQKPYVVIVGSLNSAIRDYDSAFDQIEEFKPEIDVHVVGSGDAEWKLTDDVAARVIFKKDLPYDEYYKEIAGAVAILPFIKDKDLLAFRTTPSVAASLTAGTPMLASSELLDTYTQIPGDSIWYQKTGEPEFQSLQEVIVRDKEEWTWKKQSTAGARDKLLKQNLVFFKQSLGIED